MRGIKETDNLIEKIIEKGQGLTFDNDGLPILQKPQRLNPDAKTTQTKVDEEVRVTKAIVKQRAKLAQSNQQRMAASNFTDKTGQRESADDKFEGHIQGVIEATYAEPGKNMVI